MKFFLVLSLLLAVVSAQDILKYKPESWANGNWLSVNTRTRSGVYTWQVNTAEAVSYFLLCSDESVPLKTFGNLQNQAVMTSVCPPGSGITFGWVSGSNLNSTTDAIANVIELPIVEMSTGSNYTAYGSAFKVFHYAPARFLLDDDLSNYLIEGRNYFIYDDPQKPGAYYIVANLDFRFDILNSPEDPFTYIVNENEVLNVSVKAFTYRWFCADAAPNTLPFFSFNGVIEYTKIQRYGKHCASFFPTYTGFLNATYFTAPFFDIQAGNNLQVNDRCATIRSTGGPFQYIPIRIASLTSDLFRISLNGGVTYSQVFFGNNPPNFAVSSNGAFYRIADCGGSILYTITAYTPITVDVSSAENKWNTIFTAPAESTLEWVRLVSNSPIFIDSATIQPVGFPSSTPVSTWIVPEGLQYLSPTNPLYFAFTSGPGDYNLTLTRVHFYGAGNIYNRDYPIPNLYFPGTTQCLVLDLDRKINVDLTIIQNTILASQIFSGPVSSYVALEGLLRADYSSSYVFCRPSFNKQDVYLRLSSPGNNVKFTVSEYNPTNLTFGQVVRPRIAQNVNIYLLPGILQKSAAFMFYTTLNYNYVNALVPSIYAYSIPPKASNLVPSTARRYTQFTSNFDDQNLFLVALPSGGNFTTHLSRPAQSICESQSECPANSNCANNFCQCVGDFHGPFCNLPGKLMSGASVLSFSSVLFVVLCSFFFVL